MQWMSSLLSCTESDPPAESPWPADSSRRLTSRCVTQQVLRTRGYSPSTTLLWHWRWNLFATWHDQWIPSRKLSNYLTNCVCGWHTCVGGCLTYHENIQCEIKQWVSPFLRTELSDVSVVLYVSESNMYVDVGGKGLFVRVGIKEDRVVYRYSGRLLRNLEV